MRRRSARLVLLLTLVLLLFSGCDMLLNYIDFGDMDDDVVVE